LLNTILNFFILRNKQKIYFTILLFLNKYLSIMSCAWLAAASGMGSASDGQRQVPPADSCSLWAEPPLLLKRRLHAFLKANSLVYVTTVPIISYLWLLVTGRWEGHSYSREHLNGQNLVWHTQLFHCITDKSVPHRHVIKENRGDLLSGLRRRRRAAAPHSPCVINTHHLLYLWNISALMDQLTLEDRQLYLWLLSVSHSLSPHLAVKHGDSWMTSGLSAVWDSLGA